jgi:hypothetical protein
MTVSAQAVAATAPLVGLVLAVLAVLILVIETLLDDHDPQP